MLRIILVFLLYISMLAIESDASSVTFQKERLMIQTQTNRTFRFIVEIADTEERRNQGLMYRLTLDDNEGMLFIFDRLQIATFWMHNTFISLDMLFLAQNGEIVQLQKHAVPKSRRMIASREPVKGVLELKGGLADRLGLHVGDRVIHDAFVHSGDRQSP